MKWRPDEMVKPEHFYDGSMKSGQLWRSKYVNGYVLSETLQGLLTPDSSQCLSVFWDKGAPFLTYGESTSHMKLLWPVSGQMIRETFLFLPVSQAASSFQAAMCWESEHCPEPHPILSTFWFYPLLNMKNLRFLWVEGFGDNQRAGTEWS